WSALSTVTTMPAEVALLPAVSRATAVSVWAPPVAVALFQLTDHGALVTSAPRLAPSSLSCTPATSTLSVAMAATLSTPDTVAPAGGEVTATAGGVASTPTTDPLRE